MVARQAHNLKVAGSNPAPATQKCRPPLVGGFVFLIFGQDSKGMHFDN